MHASHKPFMPAAGRDWLLPFYDPFTRLLGVPSIHRKLIQQSGLAPGFRVLEIGSGTGNLALLVKELHPDAEVVGIDPDPKALARARRKAGRHGTMIQFDPGFSEALPYPDASFDRVLSSLMLHHVEPQAKLTALQEAHRVLKPGGSLHLADFDEGARHPGGFLAKFVHARHGSSSHPMVLELMRDSGFADSQQVAHQATILGGISFCQAVRPGSPTRSVT